MINMPTSVELGQREICKHIHIDVERIKLSGRCSHSGITA